MPVHTRTLKKADVTLSELALGTWGLATGAYGPVADDALEQCVAKALELGVTTFDLALRWDDAEVRVAKAVGARRDEVQYITRGASPKRRDAEAITAEVEESLTHLGTDRLDVFLLHGLGPDALREDGWREAMRTLREAGKVRAFGASVSQGDAARLAISAGCDVVCLPYSLLWGDDAHDVAGDLAASGCGLLARSPLAYGLLAGAWSSEHRFSEDDHRARRWYPAAFALRVKQASAFRFLVRDEITTMAAASLRYVLANRQVTSALLGARTPAQLEEAAKAIDAGPPYLSDDDLTRISQVSAALGI